MGHARRIGWLAAVAGTWAAASAQQAELFITHDDPDGVVEPGQVVRFEVRANWSGVVQVLHFGGDIVATPGIGGVGAIARPDPAGYYSVAVSTNGVGANGGIHGVDHHFSPAFFVGGIVPSVSTCSVSTCGTWTTWAWTAPLVPDPTVVTWEFAPRQGETGMAGLPNWMTINTVPLDVTAYGASLTVTPTPGALGVTLCAAGLATLRRRRSL